MEKMIKLMRCYVFLMPSLTHVLRYNDYTKDPFSACNCTPPYRLRSPLSLPPALLPSPSSLLPSPPPSSAENAISARCDLNPRNGTYPFGALGHRCADWQGE